MTSFSTFCRRSTTDYDLYIGPSIGYCGCIEGRLGLIRRDKSVNLAGDGKEISVYVI